MNNNNTPQVEPKENEIKSIEENDEEEEDDDAIEDEDEYEKYVENNIDKDLERTNKKIEKYSQDIKTNLLNAQKFEKKADSNLVAKYKKEAKRALKLKKFYEKRLTKLNEKKFKIDLKTMDKDLKIQKKELRKITREFKKKVALLTNNEFENEDDNEEMDISILNIDMPENKVIEEYNKIIELKEVEEASENLNIFKFLLHN